MKSKFHFCKLALLLAFVLATNPAYTQNTGTSPESRTSSQGPETMPTQPPAVGETQPSPPHTGARNIEAARNVAWGWLILGFAIGLLVGALAWRRRVVIVREDIRRDRVA